MTTCPSCNTQNEDSAQFCVSCGTPLATAAPQVVTTLACPACGAANPPGAQFCVSCGSPLNSGLGPSGEQQTLVSAGRVPEPPAYAPTPAAEPEPSATILAPAPAPTAPLPPAADATVLAARPEAAWYPPPVPPPVAPVLPAAAAQPAGTHKELSLALALEILPALVGVFGIGWIYSGSVTAGVVLLIGMLAWEALGLVLALFTLGTSCLCFVPINLVVIALSAGLLYAYTRQHPERFGA